MCWRFFVVSFVQLLSFSFQGYEIQMISRRKFQKTSGRKKAVWGTYSGKKFENRENMFFTRVGRIYFEKNLIKFFIFWIIQSFKKRARHKSWSTEAVAEIFRECSPKVPLSISKIWFWSNMYFLSTCSFKMVKNGIKHVNMQYQVDPTDRTGVKDQKPLIRLIG